MVEASSNQSVQILELINIILVLTYLTTSLVVIDFIRFNIFGNILVTGYQRKTPGLLTLLLFWRNARKRKKTRRRKNKISMFYQDWDKFYYPGLENWYHVPAPQYGNPQYQAPQYHYRHVHVLLFKLYLHCILILS